MKGEADMNDYMKKWFKAAGVRAVKTVDGEKYYSDWIYFSHKTPKETAKSSS